jgi:hypothetical protein
VAVFAVSAVGASSASAHRTWWICEKVTEGTGKYKDSLCKEKVEKGNFEWKQLAVGTKKNIKVIKNGVFSLKAGTVTIECKKLTLKEGVIENITGPTGRDKGTVEFSECKNAGHAACVVKPVVVKGKETALVEDTTKSKVYDLFAPEGWSEEKPEETKPFAKIEEGGTFECPNTTVEGDGVAAEIIPEELSIKKTFKFPCPPIKEIINWKGATVKLKLTAFGFVNVEECGEAEVELESKEAFDVK